MCSRCVTDSEIRLLCCTYTDPPLSIRSNIISFSSYILLSSVYLYRETNSIISICACLDLLFYKRHENCHLTALTWASLIHTLSRMMNFYLQTIGSFKIHPKRMESKKIRDLLIFVKSKFFFFGFFQLK